MRKKQFLSLLAAVALVCGLVGCQADVDTTQTDTEQAVQETQQTTETTAVQTKQLINEIKTTSVQTTKNVVETQIETKDFVYPNDPLTAENLLKITTAAKVKLLELGETSNKVCYYTFGLIDVDFDGFPEMFCEFSNAVQGRHNCRMYSLKEENFCEFLFEYKAHFEGDGDTTYLVKGYRGKQSIIVYSLEKHRETTTGNTYINEVTEENGKFINNELFSERWDMVHSSADEWELEPVAFYAGGKEVDFLEYQKAYKKLIVQLTPATYLYEDIYYTSNVKKEIPESIDKIYDLYVNYVNALLYNEKVFYYEKE